MDITTGKVRLSFVNIFKPKTQLNGDSKYSVTMIIPKSDIETLNNINKAMETAIQEGISKTFNGTKPPIIKKPLYDGDGLRPNGEPFGAECKGCMVITATTGIEYPPVIVDLNRQPIIDPTTVYSGCYGRVNISFKAYNVNGSKGVGCYLRGVQKIEDGEPLTAHFDAEKAFKDSDKFLSQPVNTTPIISNYNQSSAINPIIGQPVNTSAIPNYNQNVAINPITGQPIQGSVMGL